MRRKLIVIGLLTLLVGLAGCVSLLGPGEPNRARLNQNASYEWEHNVSVYIELRSSSYSSVYNVTNRSTLEVYSRGGLGQEHYLSLSALQYRYPNGTVITANSSVLSVDLTRERTIITLPNGSDGMVAFTAPRNGKTFSTPVFVEGSHAIRLPSNARVGIPLLSRVSPGGYTTVTNGAYTTVRWEDVTGDGLLVRWYLERDLLLFTGLAVIAIILGSGGALYYYRQMRRARKRREETGITIDGEDDDVRDRGPPPGMR